MRRVLVTNLKGGCGKTTIATNLAAALAASGMRVALADADRQRSSLAWLSLRDEAAAPIKALDWHKEVGDPPRDVAWLVIDAPANLRMKDVTELVSAADTVIVPVLPSLFDEESTRRFLERLRALKPLRKGRKQVLVVANRVRARSRAQARLLSFLQELDEEPTAIIADRSSYGEVAINGRSIFDCNATRVRAELEEWRPLVRALEARDGC